MRAEFINPFLEAAMNVLSTMANISSKLGKPALREESGAEGDISGIIGLTGDAEGSITVSFSESCALKVVENMLGEKFEELNEDVADSMGEITNMIAGDARARLEKLGHRFVASLPSVVRGKNHKVRHISRGGQTIFIPFTTESGDFYVEARFSQ